MVHLYSPTDLANVVTCYPWEIPTDPPEWEPCDEVQAWAETLDVNPMHYRPGITEDELADDLADRHYVRLMHEWAQTGVCPDPADAARQDIERAASVLIHWITAIHTEQGA